MKRFHDTCTVDKGLGDKPNVVFHIQASVFTWLEFNLGVREECEIVLEHLKISPSISNSKSRKLLRRNIDHAGNVAKVTAGYKRRIKT